MKKFVCIILSVLFIIPCFAFPASADDSSSTFSPEDYLSLIPPSRDAPCIVAVKRSDDGKSVRISYIYPLDFPSGGTIDYHTDTDTYCTTNDYVYQSEYYAYSITENKITASGSSTLPSTSSLSLKRFVSVEPCPPTGGSNVSLSFRNINITVDGSSIYNPNNCPDVFTYSIDRNNFTLQNNQSLTVNISFTSDYVNFISKLRQDFPSVSSLYNFVIYVSNVKPTNTDTLVQSLSSSRYTKLQYGEYLYEGGVGYSHLGENPNSMVVSDDASSLSEIPTSHSGKSPWTKAIGAHICTTLGVDAGVSSYPIDIRLENIEGFNDHTPIYVCVLGAYCGEMNDPQAFNEYNISNALQGHSSPNDTYSEFFETHTEAENETPDYTFHTYYFPFECVDNCVGDGYQGNCTYKPQVVNGKEYPNKPKVSDYTNKGTKPDAIHDVDMDSSQWVKPEDYPKWQHDRYNSSRYSNEFNYDVVGLKDVLDQESDFFKFLTSAFNVFPPYVINIFVGFLVCLLAIVLIKFIL